MPLLIASFARCALRPWRLAFVAAVLALWLPTSMAASMHVAPVRVVLGAERSIAALVLGNAEEHEIAVQAEVLRWTQKDGKDVYEPTRDVLVNPSIFRVPGRGQQIVRLGLQVPGGDSEGAYRLFLQQLPREVPTASGEGSMQMQTLLRIGVPVFVPPRQARALPEWRLAPDPARPGGLRLWLDNQGNEHLQLTHVRVHRADGELLRQSLSLYVLPGESGSVGLPMPALPADTALQIELSSDSATPLPVLKLAVPRATAASAAP